MRDKRRVGLRMTGRADALMMIGLRYGSLEARSGQGTGPGRSAGRPTSPPPVWPSRRGAFPLFDRDAYLGGETVGGLDEDACSAPSARLTAARWRQKPLIA
jgi:ribonucleoside-diphosphate reductase alpha chain